jgi:hypothetical protein
VGFCLSGLEGGGDWGSAGRDSNLRASDRSGTVPFRCRFTPRLAHEARLVRVGFGVADFEQPSYAVPGSMKPLLCILVAILGFGCAKAPVRTKTESFFVDWLQAHGETNVIVDAGGVGIGGNATRLKASVYGSNRNPNGTCVVEAEFRIRLPSGGEIVEFVAGMGDSEDKALNDSLVNFALSTFHVVYKSFINPTDPHQTLESVTINSSPRQLAMGDLYMRGSSTNDPPELSTVRSQIRAAIGGLPLSAEPHWIKIVYSQTNGMPMTVSATLDNKDQPALTAAASGFAWPKQEAFYLAKEFVVVK